MILQALKDYYDRMAAEGRIEPLGWERKEIPFLVDLDESGRFTHFPTRASALGKNFGPTRISFPVWAKAKEAV